MIDQYTADTITMLELIIAEQTKALEEIATFRGNYAQTIAESCLVRITDMRNDFYKEQK